MANLKEIRNRIVSVSSTMQITSAMKMVSAAKLKKAQDAINSMRPYASKLNNLIQNLSSSLEPDMNIPYVSIRKKNSILLVAITSNRGLCGAFNSNVIKKTRQLVEEFSNKKVSLITIGKKGSEILGKKYKIISTHDYIFDDLNYKKADEISKEIMDSFKKELYDEIILVYNRFKNAATQIVETESFLPIEENLDEKSLKSPDYIFEPNQSNIVNELLPKALSIKFFKALRDSFASEHGARMTAMHKATDNATELRDQLKLTYNKARQAAITNEILEIVGGAEALEG
tara:strand:+ start:328 stop:1188 length:861 start_codon:yes stop_codon:yes gene_type:complete